MENISVLRKAMNDEFEILFPRQKFPHGTEAALDALDEIDRLEHLLSVFKFDSKVQIINTLAASEPIQLEDELFGLISRCIEISSATDGAVDITNGPLWKLWGFARREGKMPKESEIDEALNYVGFRNIILDKETKSIKFAKTGVELNFGCVGKGFALDVGAEKLYAKGIDDFLFRGGFSSVLARGDSWTIGVADPLRPGKRLCEIQIHNESVATSDSMKQFFRHNGKRYSHIINPRVGIPAQGVLSVTVKAPDATLAELLSTAFFVMGREQTEAYCKEHPEIFVIITDTNGSTQI